MIEALTAASNQSLGQYAAAGGLATETLGAVRTVSALNAQPDVIAKYRVYLFKAMQVGIVKGFNVGLGNGGLFGSVFLTYALGFWYAATLMKKTIDDGCTHNCLTGGDVAAVFECMIMGSIALGQMAPPIGAFTSAKVAIGKLMETVNRKPLIDGLSDQGLKPTIKTHGAIELNNITFSYPSRPNIVVCKDYSLKIEAGQSVALVGASGCGKSTIINLLLRFYDPQSGDVSIDGMNIRDLNIRWLRSQIGYVGQEPILFAGTVGDNISYGLDPELLDATSTKALTKEQLRERIIAAATLANAHEFISAFPQGYDTDVGSNGVAMSGGQKQRIAIARALIKKPSVLLLDEATSALDATSERVVQESIDKLSRNKSQTTIIIAHRLSTIRNADKICLITQGQIAEMGTHDELFALNGLYADLVRLQMSGHDDGDADGEGEEAETSQGHFTGDDAARIRTVSHASVTGSGKGGDSVKLASAKRSVIAGADELSKERSANVTSRIWGMILEHAGWLLVACIGAICYGGVMPALGYMLAYAQSMFFLTDTDELMRRAILFSEIYIMLAGVSIVAATCQFWGVAQVAERVSISLRSQMFEALMRRDISFFDKEENSIGTLTTRLSDDSRIVNKAFGDNLARQLQAFFCLMVALVLGFTASWKVSLVVIAAFPLSIVASVVQMEAMAGQQYNNDEPAESDVKTATSDKQGKDTEKKKVSGGHGAIISTAFTHMRTVSAFSMQHKVSEDYLEITDKLAKSRAGRAVVGGFGFGGAQGAQFVTYALLFWYGSTLIKSGDITFLQLMSSIWSLMMGAMGLGMALADLGDQKVGVLTADRIFKSIDEASTSPIDGVAIKGVVPTSRASGRVELKNVSFRYPSRPDVQVCKGMNLSIEPGEMIAFVGPSGSGKSTIINLLLRFYDPVSGSVSVDGHDLKDLSVRWLRSQIGYVGQEPVLFTGSVAENIAKGRVDTLEQPVLSLQEAMQNSDNAQTGLLSCFMRRSSGAGKPVTHAAVAERDVEMGVNAQSIDQDIIDACIASNAHDFIKSFPQGYDTDIGEGSIMVSGGQKQRIAIARALIKKPTILLLDEATSALDATSERVVQESIDALQKMKAQTTIVIAHRLSTIRNADKIVVIDKGVVVETGKHDELLARGGLYATLWNKQSGSA
jgi:ATP-binding cassette subfamily B (MDR/TAP) protein 1